MESFEKQLIRQYTRKEKPEERKTAAAEILAERGGFFEAQKALQDKIENLSNRVKSKQEDLEALTHLYDETKLLLDQEERRFMKWLFGRAERQQLSQKLQDIGRAQEVLEEECGEVQAVLAVAKQETISRNSLDRAKGRLAEFYSTAEKNLKTFFEKEKIDRDVKEVMKRHKVFFAHGINLNRLPEGNSLLVEGAHWKEKFKLLLALRPTISTSTFREGDSERAIYAATMGVLMGGGHVEAASYRDAGTRAAGIKKRLTWENPTKQLLAHGAEEIERAVGSPEDGPRQDYNELVVRDPEPVGLFVVLPDKLEDSNGELVTRKGSNLRASNKEIVDFANEMSLSLYAIQNGEVFEAQIIEEEREYETWFGRKETRKSWELKLGEQVHPEDLTVRAKEILEPSKLNLLEGVLVDPPFQAKVMPDADFVNSRAVGRGDYVKIASLRGEYYSHIIRGVGFQDKYESNNGTLEHTRFWTRPHFRNGAQGITEFTWKISEDSSEWNYLYAGGWQIQTPERLTTVESYIRAIDIERKRCETGRHETTFQSSKDMYASIIIHLGFQLFGFAEQAEIMGDVDTANKARESAKLCVSAARYEEVKKRRLNASEQFVLQPEEVGVSK